MAIMYPLRLTWGGTVPHVHNLFLQVAIDLGVPGLIAYLSIGGLSVYMALEARRALAYHGEHAPAMLATGGLASLTGIAIHGLLDCAVWGNKGAFLPWMVLGLCAGLYHLSQDGQQEAR